MKQKTVLKKIQEIILPYLDEPYEITLDTHFLHDLMINSVDYMSIITDIEATFKLRIDDFSMYCIKDLIQFIMKNSKKED
jgi:phosphopantetheine attachment domain protein